MSQAAADELERQISHHNDLYWNRQAPVLGDQEFDALVRQLTALRPGSPVLQQLGPTPAARGTDAAHAEPMLSLDKCYDDDTLNNWLKDIRGDVLIMPKADGLAVSLLYQDGRLVRAATRGSGEVGEDITANAKQIRDIPSTIESKDAIEVRGEVYMSLAAFEHHRGDKSNPRNLAAGALRQKDPAKTGEMKLSFWGYDVRRRDVPTQSGRLALIRSLGLPALEHTVVARADARAAIATLQARRGELGYETDGIVLVADDVAEHARLGATAHHPRYALAWKFQGDEGTSVLRGIEWSVARTGTITPVALVDAVALSGVTVTRATLHNLGFIEKMGLTIGAGIAMVRRGGVIPHVERVITPGTLAIEVPAACPSCGSATNRSGDFLYCGAPNECVAARVGRLLHFVSAIDIQGLGEAVVEELVTSGRVKTPADLYALTAKELAAIERTGEKNVVRLGDKNAAKIVAELERARTMPLDVLLRSLGIDSLGKTASRALAERFGTLEAVRAATLLALQEVRGVGELVAESVQRGLQEQAAAIDALLLVVRVGGAAVAPTGGVLSGKSFVFTGALRFDRKQAEKRVLAAGGTVASSVGKALQYLVVGSSDRDKPSTKMQAAQKLQAAGAALQIIDEDGFEALFVAPS